MKNTPKSLTPIKDGEMGKFSKIREEYLELKDAIKQKNKKLTFIESCDLINATLQFTWVPSPVVILIVYLRRLYKPIRDRIYDYAGLKKSDFNGEYHKLHERSKK